MPGRSAAIDTAERYRPAARATARSDDTKPSKLESRSSSELSTETAHLLDRSSARPMTSHRLGFAGEPGSGPQETLPTP
jgi:putative protein kinase ArgK-like GTPase of G3E family